MHDAYIWVLDHVLGVEKVREVWDSVTGFVAAGIGDLWSAAVLPLMWITMTAVIYGRAVHKAEKPQQVRWRFDRITHRWQRTPQIVRAAGNSVVSDWKDRWTPVVSRVPPGRPLRDSPDARLLPGLGGRHVPRQRGLDHPA